MNDIRTALANAAAAEQEAALEADRQDTAAEIINALQNANAYRRRAATAGYLANQFKQNGNDEAARLQRGHESYDAAAAEYWESRFGRAVTRALQGDGIPSVSVSYSQTGLLKIIAE